MLIASVPSKFAEIARRPTFASLTPSCGLASVRFVRPTSTQSSHRVKVRCALHLDSVPDCLPTRHLATSRGPTLGSFSFPTERASPQAVRKGPLRRKRMRGAMIHRRTAIRASHDYMRSMNDDKYNGWTNRETWAVRLWIDNDRDTHFFWRDVTRSLKRKEPADAAGNLLAQQLEDAFDELIPQHKHGVFADLLTTAIGRVNWHEIAQSMLDDEDDPEPPQSKPAAVVIYSYTRAQAIEDGVLVDVSGLAKEAGFKIPVALTTAVWETCVRIPEGVTCQDETGHLWDVLNVLLFSIRGSRANRNANDVKFAVSVRNSNEGNEDVRLKALCGPGDNAEPVITIMLPNED